MELLTKVADIFRARQEKKASGFDELVKAVADGGKKSPSAEQIAAALEETGKTPEDLAAGVKHRQERAEFVRHYATLPTLQSQLAELQRKGDAEAARFAPLEEEHKATVRRLNQQAAALGIQIEDAQKMKDNLQISYVGPLRDELAEIGKQRQEIERLIRSAEATGREHEHQAEWGDTPAAKASRRTAAEGCMASAAEQKKKLPPLAKREAEIMAAMLKP